MKSVYWLACLLFVVNGYAESFEWGDLKKDRIALKFPLLTIQGNKGVLACSYINVSTCDKTAEACAIVSGVSNHQDMLAKPVIAISKAASELGIKIGMSGADALGLLR